MRGAGVVSLLGLLAAFVSCGPPANSSSPPRVILIGVDGLDPELLLEAAGRGKMPVLGSLMARGASGELTSMEPMLSPLLWTTVATGMTPDQHGITDFVERNAAGDLESITRSSRRRPALWGILGKRHLRCGVVAFWATYPAEAISGFVIADRFVSHGFRASPAAREALVTPASLRDEVLSQVVSAKDLPIETIRQVANVSGKDWARSRELGPSDRLHHLALAIADTMSVRQATLAATRREPVDVLFVYFEGIDTVGHLFMSDRGGAGPFAGTVDRFYSFQDENLAPIVAMAGPETTILVVSDHGFRHGSDRPAIGEGDSFEPASAVRWHRLSGTIVAAGPGIAPGSRISGSLLDVAPTVLSILGAPVAADMKGVPIAAIARERIARIPSYGVDTPTQAAPPAPDDAEALERLRALGYIDAKHASPSMTAASHFNRARSLQEAGKREEAEGEYREALRIDPGSVQAMVNLGGLALARGDRTEAARLFEAALAKQPDHSGALNNLALMALDATPPDPARAEQLFSRAIAADPSRADARKNLAMLLASRGDLSGAQRELTRALELTPEDRRAWAALAEIAAAREDRATADAARKRLAELPAGAPP
ncbi:MAG: alkaline phosphatase family protein [Acidobacteriota bacterium]